MANPMSPGRQIPTQLDLERMPGIIMDNQFQTSFGHTLFSGKRRCELGKAKSEHTNTVIAHRKCGFSLSKTSYPQRRAMPGKHCISRR